MKNYIRRYIMMNNWKSEPSNNAHPRVRTFDQACPQLPSSHQLPPGPPGFLRLPSSRPAVPRLTFRVPLTSINPLTPPESLTELHLWAGVKGGEGGAALKGGAALSSSPHLSLLIRVPRSSAPHLLSLLSSLAFSASQLPGLLSSSAPAASAPSAPSASSAPSLLLPESSLCRWMLLSRPSRKRESRIRSLG